MNFWIRTHSDDGRERGLEKFSAENYRKADPSPAAFIIKNYILKSCLGAKLPNIFLFLF